MFKPRSTSSNHSDRPWRYCSTRRARPARVTSTAGSNGSSAAQRGWLASVGLVSFCGRRSAGVAEAVGACALTSRFSCSRRVTESMDSRPHQETVTPSCAGSPAVSRITTSTNRADLGSGDQLLAVGAAAVGQLAPLKRVEQLADEPRDVFAVEQVGGGRTFGSAMNRPSWWAQRQTQPPAPALTSSSCASISSTSTLPS
jgi:hypothetical protein